MSTEVEESNLYAPPSADVGSGPSDEDSAAFFPVSTTKMWVMSIGTLSIYWICWFYKNWKHQSAQTGEKVRPFWRAVFYVFFTHELFRRIEHDAEEGEVSKSWQAPSMATMVVVLAIAGRLLDRASNAADASVALQVASFVPLFIQTALMVKVQKTVNAVNGDEKGHLNCSFSAVNIVGLLFGGLLWLAIIASFFIPAEAI